MKDEKVTVLNWHWAVSSREYEKDVVRMRKSDKLGEGFVYGLTYSRGLLAQATLAGNGLSLYSDQKTNLECSK